jgi:hypothetical protein
LAVAEVLADSADARDVLGGRQGQVDGLGAG